MFLLVIFFTDGNSHGMNVTMNFTTNLGEYNRQIQVLWLVCNCMILATISSWVQGRSTAYYYWWTGHPGQ